MSASGITGRVVSSTSADGKVTTVFEIPAITSRQATRRARVNARLKGLDSPQINEPQMIGQGDIPGRKIYEVEVVSNR